MTVTLEQRNAKRPFKFRNGAGNGRLRGMQTSCSFAHAALPRERQKHVEVVKAQATLNPLGQFRWHIPSDMGTGLRFYYQ